MVIFPEPLLAPMRLCVTLLLLNVLFGGSHLCAQTLASGLERVSDGHSENLNLKALSRDPQWLALLHYGKRKQGHRELSYVDDPKFFLSDIGSTDPYSELRATVQQLQSERDLRCRFPARASWLQAQGLLTPDSESDCPEYRQWRTQINAGSIALVFAASYLNSPSSMYGHTFLRIDPQGYRSESALLSYAINYAAIVPPDDNSLLFAWKGMSGGYQGLFTLQPYVEKLQEYSRLENRDIWEYELDLGAEELDRLMAHVWELQYINIDYYFMDENCSFRLLELLEVARPELNLTSAFGLHAIPVDTVRAVRDVGMVSDVVYRPSRQQELGSLLAELHKDEKSWVLKLAAEPHIADDDAFRRLDSTRQRKMVLAAYRLLRYRHNREARDSEVAAKSFALLQTLSSLPREVETDVTKAESAPLQPELGHATGQWGLARGEVEERAYTELDVRLTYHDLLDPLAGYPEAASLNMLHAVLRKVDGAASKLQSLDIIDIRSLATRDQFFRPVSWQVHAGAERQLVSDTGLSSFVQAGAGGSWRALGASVSLIATARVEYSEVFTDNWQAAPGLAARVAWQLPHFAAALEAEHYRFVNGVDRNLLTLQIQQALSVNQGLRFSWSRQLQDSRSGEEVSLQWRRYF